MEFGDQSLEFFEMAAKVLECMENVHRSTLDLALYVQDWSGILLRYEHDEVRYSHVTLVYRKTALITGSSLVGKV